MPLRLPIDFDNPNDATFSARYTEPYYVGFEMIQKSPFSGTIEKQASESVGYKGEQPQYDLSWKVFEGDTLLASGPGKLYGMVGSTIALGSLQLVAGKSYRIQVIPGPGSAFLKPTNPVLEVGVDHAAVSVGLALGGELDKLLFKLAAYALFIVGVLLFGITFAAHKIQNSLTPAPTAPPPKAAAGG